MKKIRAYATLRKRFVETYEGMCSLNGYAYSYEWFFYLTGLEPDEMERIARAIDQLSKGLNQDNPSLSVITVPIHPQGELKVELIAPDERSARQLRVLVIERAKTAMLDPNAALTGRASQSLSKERVLNAIEPGRTWTILQLAEKLGVKPESLRYRINRLEAEGLLTAHVETGSRTKHYQRAQVAV